MRNDVKVPEMLKFHSLDNLFLIPQLCRTMDTKVNIPTSSRIQQVHVISLLLFGVLTYAIARFPGTNSSSSVTIAVPLFWLVIVLSIIYTSYRMETTTRFQYLRIYSLIAVLSLLVSMIYIGVFGGTSKSEMLNDTVYVAIVTPFASSLMLLTGVGTVHLGLSIQELLSGKKSREEIESQVLEGDDDDDE